MRLFLVISLSAALGACSSSPTVAEPVVVVSESTTTTTTQPEETTTTTLDPEAADRAEIEDVLTRFYSFTYDFGFVDGRPGLEEVSAPPIYDRILENGNEFARKGYVLGEGDNGTSVAEIEFRSATSAIAKVCLLDEAPILSADGDQITERTPDPVWVTADVQATPSGWRVIEWRYLGGQLVPCDF